MIGLFFRIWLAQLRQSWGKILLTILGIAVGSAGFVAIRLANEAAARATRDTLQSLSTNTPIVLRSASGELSETLIKTVRAVPGVEGTVPQMVRYLAARRGEEDLGLLQVIGADLLQQHGNGGKVQPRVIRNLFAVRFSALATSEIGQEDLSLRVNGRLVPVGIEGTLSQDGLGAAYSGKLLVLEIAALQDLLQQFGSIDSLGVIPKTGVDLSKLRSALRAALPPEILVDEPEGLQREAAHATKALRLNLDFLASLSLVVSALLIYNSVSFLMLQRRREFGILRAIGARVTVLRMMLLTEAGLIGLISGLLGLAAGRTLSGGLVQQVTNTVATLYAPGTRPHAILTNELILQTLSLGIFVAVAGALLPILEASATPIRDLFFKQTFEHTADRQLLPLTLFGLATVCLAFGLTELSGLSYSLYFGFFPPIILTLGWLCLGPLIGWGCTRLFSAIAAAANWPIVSLASVHLRTSPRRSSATMTAVGIALGLFLGVSTMIASFRSTVENWLEQVLKADVYISTSASVAAGSRTALPEEVLRWLQAQPEAREVDLIRNRTIRLRRDANRPAESEQVFVSGVRFDIIAQERRLIFLRGGADLTDSPDGILVSESFTRRFGDHTSVELPGAEGAKRFRVLGVFSDYSSEHGTIFMPVEQFRAFFKQDSIQGASLYLLDGRATAALKERLFREFKDISLTIRDNGELRREVLRVFDQTFAVTYALQAIALIISLFVIVNAVLMLSVERGRELGVLWAVGLRQSRLKALLALDSFALGTGGAISGVLQGLSLSFLLVYFINRFFFGWSITLSLSLPLYAGTVGAVLLLSLVVGWVAATFRPRALELLRYE